MEIGSATVRDGSQGRPISALQFQPQATFEAPSSRSTGHLMSEVGPQLDKLGCDPELQEQYYTTIAMLAQLDPEAAQTFVKSVGLQLDMRMEIESAGGKVEIDFSLQFEEVRMARRQGADSVRKQMDRMDVHIRSLVEQWEIVKGNGPADDPLTLDLNGDGQLSFGARRDFDINGDGRAENVAWVSGGDALVALDRNGNGEIDDGRELFGDQHGADNGFDELAKYDDNGDGAIDASDEVYDELVLLGDFDGDGDSDDRRKLADMGVSRIDLGYRNTKQWLRPDVLLTQAGSFVRDGATHLAGSLVLKYA